MARATLKQEGAHESMTSEGPQIKAMQAPGPMATVTGVQLMQGLGVQPAKGFWADAWDHVAKRGGARFAIVWLGIVLFFALFSPIIANGHPILYRVKMPTGEWGGWTSPILENMSSVDVLLLLIGFAGGAWMFLAKRLSRSERLGVLTGFLLACGAGLIAGSFVLRFIADMGGTKREMIESRPLMWGRLTLNAARPLVMLGVALIPAIVLGLVLPFRRKGKFLGAVLAAVVIVLLGSVWWRKPLQTFPYQAAVESRRAEAVFTLVPFSPNQRSISADLLPPLTSSDMTQASLDELNSGRAVRTPGRSVYWLGTDSFGQDVVSQLMHACRVAISLGLVSTGIAVAIGVTIGALMGYFGGWVDMVLLRVVEAFMAMPVLFLLIIAAAVLPRNLYVTMALIGCVTWTGAARFIRAEFMRLRHQDFVQAAQALGLPLRSILFKHMLPNGVTPVLVDASFGIAVAISAEVTLSFLGLGPEEQSSWGRLLTDTTNNVGAFMWWLGVFPGAAIFLTVLSYNLMGEALRDAIDPKLKKARV
ncbi:MAG: ABC transporter permease [Phycisphaerales bacterium]|nr:MAG: ABC transporter permease [Phycisphaerales bacterium]